MRSGRNGPSSQFRPISSDAKALDGLNVQVAVCDEIASHKTSEVYDVLLTAMGKRRNPLLLAISTATGNNAGIGKQLWDYAVRVLEGTQEDERLFALIYTIDPEDDPWDEASWIKANPSWGQAVQPEAIRAIMRQARNNPAQEAAAKTRHLNIWVGADEALFSLRSWRECARLRRSASTTSRAESAIWRSTSPAAPISRRWRSCSRSRIRETGKTHYTAFARCYVNEAAVMEARNPSYPGWAAEGYLVITPGNETDFGTHRGRHSGPLQALQGASASPTTRGRRRSWRSGSAPRACRCVEFRANTQNFTRADQGARCGDARGPHRA